jgi:hypothetical protein
MEMEMRRFYVVFVLKISGRNGRIGKDMQDRIDVSG